jgi:hypothetical protein
MNGLMHIYIRGLMFIAWSGLWYMHVCVLWTPEFEAPKICTHNSWCAHFVEREQQGSLFLKRQVIASMSQVLTLSDLASVMQQLKRPEQRLVSSRLPTFVLALLLIFMERVSRPGRSDLGNLVLPITTCNDHICAWTWQVSAQVCTSEKGVCEHTRWGGHACICQRVHVKKAYTYCHGLWTRHMHTIFTARPCMYACMCMLEQDCVLTFVLARPCMYARTCVHE